MSILSRGTNSSTGKWTFSQTNNPDYNKPSTLISTNNNPYANSFIINFPVSQRIENAEVAVENLVLYRSWFNILKSYQNTLLQYSWYYTGAYHTFTVGAAFGLTDMPEGSYEVSDIVNYMQLDMHERGFYLVFVPTDSSGGDPFPSGADDSDGTPTYFLNMVVNTTYYCITVISTPTYATEADANAAGYYVPTAFATQWRSSPGWFTGFSPQLIVPASTNPAGTYSTLSLGSMSKVLGIAPGTYPSSSETSPNAINGTFPPQVETVNVVNVACSLINNASVSRFANVLYTTDPNVVNQGDALQPSIYERSYLPMTDGQYNFVQVNLYDDNLTPLPQRDPSVLITLSYRMLSPTFQSSPYASLPSGTGTQIPQQVVTTQSAVPINFGSYGNQSHLRAAAAQEETGEQTVAPVYSSESGAGVRKRRAYGRF